VSEDRVQRRLAAIVAADIVGYSRMMENNEAGTLAAVKALRADLLYPTVASYGGRIVKTTGDGALIEFPSAVHAVSCCIDVQRVMGERNAARPAAERIETRMGINVGDVILDDEDIYGDGVTIAARLEGLAEAGAVYVSNAVHEQVSGKLDVVFDDLGEQIVKNISRPVRVFRIRLADPDAPRAEGPSPMSDRPSIAVLPFQNMSGDPEQEYFADGMVEEIITGLARIRWLMVIARNSTFAYKGKSPDVRKVGRELAVRYVLEGSVRKSGDRVRITVQLIEADAGGHLWAERFDGTLADIFDLQDQITAGVVAAIEPSVRQAETERAKRKRPGNLDAYDLYLRALEQAYTYTRSGRTAALSLLDSAIALDPRYAEAHGVAAWCRQQRYLWDGLAAEDRTAALHHAEAVMAARTDDATALAFAAFALAGLAHKHEAAFVMLERALSQNPSSATALHISAAVNMIVGRYDQCQQHAERALRLSPFDPLRYFSEASAAAAKLALGQTEAALSGATRILEANPHFLPGLIMMTLCLVRLGRLEEARSTVRTLLDMAPDTRTSLVRERFFFADALDFERVAADLRAAGLPD
jgi:TolB-like protein/class 3 adenylate cyclase